MGLEVGACVRARVPGGTKHGDSRSGLRIVSLVITSRFDRLLYGIGRIDQLGCALEYRVFAVKDNKKESWQICFNFKRMGMHRMGKCGPARSW